MRSPAPYVTAGAQREAALRDVERRSPRRTRSGRRRGGRSRRACRRRAAAGAPRRPARARSSASATRAALGASTCCSRTRERQVPDALAVVDARARLRALVQPAAVGEHDDVALDALDHERVSGAEQRRERRGGRPATGMPTASRCTALIPRSMRPVTPRRASPLRVRGGPFHPLRREPCSVGVPGDDVLAREQRNHAAEREERAEREVHLASAQPLAREHRRASARPPSRGPRSRPRRPCGPRKSPSTNTSLTSPIPMPPGAMSAATSRKRPAPNAAIPSSGRSETPERAAEDDADDRERERDAIGDDPVAQVDRADADERERQHERRDQLARRAEAPSDRAAGDRRDERERGRARDAPRPGRLLEKLVVALRAGGDPGLERLPGERAEATADRGQRADGSAHSPRAARRMTSSGGSMPVQRRNDRAPCRTSNSSPSTTGSPAAPAAAASGVGEPSAR